MPLLIYFVSQIEISNANENVITETSSIAQSPNAGKLDMTEDVLSVTELKKPATDELKDSKSITRLKGTSQTTATTQPTHTEPSAANTITHDSESTVENKPLKDKNILHWEINYEYK